MAISFVFYFISSVVFASAQYGESWISPAGQFEANHGSTLVELPNNTLMACWYAGSREGGNNVQIYCSQKLKSESTWSTPSVAVAHGETAEGAWLKNKTLGNPSLFLDPEGTLWLFYTSVQIGGWAGGKVDYKTSKNFGQTWSKGQRLIDDFGNLTRTKPLLLSTSPVKFMLPLYHEFIKKNGYTCTLEVHDGKITTCDCNEVPGDHHFQPSIVNFKNKIHAYFRDSDKNSVFTAEFDDSKQEWSEPVATNLPNPDSSVDALEFNDHVLIVFNNHNSERSPLSLAISEDGLNFKSIWDFEKFGENVEYSYPAFIKSNDQTFYLSYSFEKRNAIKNVEFNLDWLNQHL